jgi:hypothetical protein
VSLTRFDKSFRRQKLASAQKLLFIGLPQYSLNAYVISVGDVDGDTDWYLAAFDRT